MSIQEQLELAQTTIAVLCAVLVLLCCYIVSPHSFTARKDEDATMCPLHRSDAKQCKRYHKDED